MAGCELNQMHALLGEHWPGARRLFKNLDSDIAMAFLHRFPTPQHLAEVTVEELRGWLREHPYRIAPRRAGARRGGAALPR